MCSYFIENCLMFLNYFNVNVEVDFGYLESFRVLFHGIRNYIYSGVLKSENLMSTLGKVG